MLFAGTASQPLQLMRVTLVPAAAGPVTVRVMGAGVRTPQPVRIETAEGASQVVEVPVAVAAPHGPGSTLPVTVIAESEHERAEQPATLTAAEPGWTVWLVSHFHYDPVWWNTQGQFTQSRLLLPGEDGELPEVRTAFELVKLHLDAARTDPDYKFVLAEIDYLKPYFDTHPDDRADLRALLADGRIELVGGNYNEPNTNLTCAESTIRNAVYGMAAQREVAGGDPRSAWMLDAFGFDPGYPGLMAAAGLTSSAWARGPFHQWGPWRTVGGNSRMQFATEFEWLSPDGSGLLTSYMANHYGAGWGVHQAADLAAAQAQVLGQLALLAPVAATRNVLLPVGADHVIPARWATALHRDFAARYRWPRCVTAIPREFFAAVRAEAASRRIWLSPQTRDMNPVYPGKDVSYIDTKQAQRAAEVAVLDSERLATLAWLAGADYPAASLDKAWRLLVYGAHHDAITGTESDQVYLDLLAGWREAFERGDAARRAAVAYLAGLADTRPPAASPGNSRPVTVINPLSWPRSGLASITLTFGEPGPPWLVLTDGTAASVPFLAEGVRRHPDGTLAAVTITFLAGQVPAAGFRTYWAVAAAGPGNGDWAPMPGTAIANETFEIAADPARGGTLTSIRDRRTGTELLHGPGNELVLQPEYDYHPRWGEGPWLLSPRGPGSGSAAAPADVRAERCPAGSRLVARFTLGGLRVTQEMTLWHGLDRVQFRTHVDGSIGQDMLLRVRFPASVPGALPLYQAATAVVGRPFGTADADAAEHPFTLDNPAQEWFGLGSAARVVTGSQAWPLGTAEVIAAGPDPAARDLLAALARHGVTATCGLPDGPRYGSLDLDSNLPDCRIVLGGPDANPWAARLLASLGTAESAELAARLAAGQRRIWVPAARPRAEVFRPSADVRGERDLPVLVVAGPDPARELAADLASPVIEADLLAPSPDPPLAGHVVGLLNRGTPSGLVTPDGTLHIALMRASSAWPAGVWIDGPRRTVPDGSSFAWQHWTHTFEYALVAGAGDWRAAGFGLAGQEYNHDLLTCETGIHTGPLPAATSLCSVTSPGQAQPAAGLATLKPRGNPLAAGRPGQPDRAAGVTARLRDLAGQTGPALVSLSTGITGARLVSLLEDTDGPALPPTPEGAVVQVPAAGTVTLVLAPAASPPGPGAIWPGAGATPAAPASPPEPAQPVFTRYWLHGKGPAPAGNLPVAVHLSPGRLALGPAGTGTLRLTVAGGPEPASGEVTLAVPAGLTAATDRPPRYQLPAGGHASWEVGVRAGPGTPTGRYYLAAAIRDGLGQVLEDVALVTVGEPPAPPLDLPLAELLPLIADDEQRAAAEADLRLSPAAVRLPPGGCGELVAEISNGTAAPIRGECQLISPHGSWPLLGAAAHGFAAGPGQTARLRFAITVPAAARPGSSWWALAKLMYFGRVRYSECARVEIS